MLGVWEIKSDRLLDGLQGVAARVAQSLCSYLRPQFRRELLRRAPDPKGNKVAFHGALPL